MAEFLPTTGISYRLEQIIKDAEQRLIIISPFLRINDRIKGLLEDKDRMKIDIRVVYGKNELRPEENNWLASKNSIRTSFLKDLHAKCYLNEHQALVTSMNFYEFSQVNNYEMGILVSSEEDSKLYQAIVEESERIIRAAEEIRVTVSTGERVRDDAAPKAIERPRKKTRNAQASPRTASAFGAVRPSHPIQPSHTARGATPAGSGTRTKNKRRTAATPAARNTRLPSSNRCATPATRSMRACSSLL